MALTSTPEEPLPVRTVARSIGEWIGRLGRIWVEGQVTDISRRPGMSTAFLTLRDPVADVSLQVACPRGICDAVVPPLAEGARVVVWAKPEFHLTRGSLRLTAYEIRPVGVGALLARLEQLKKVLAAEGLFAAGRKRPLPFLPRAVGLVTGRASAAEHDVVENARRRWPAVRIVLREVAVQGPLAVSQVTDALQALDRDPAVEVIVIARGGGSLEDLLPFSDEALVRAVAAARTPVVSAIGHEQDSPLLDFVADVRASTPTDAGKRVVPDVREELHRISTLRDRGGRAVTHRVDRETAAVAALLSRPVLAEPARDLGRREQGVVDLLARARRRAEGQVERAEQDVAHTVARVRALSPAATLERGYAVVRAPGGPVIRDAAAVSPGMPLEVLVAQGRFDAVVADPPADPTKPAGKPRARRRAADVSPAEPARRAPGQQGR